jgi:hypothetical protein
LDWSVEGQAVFFFAVIGFGFKPACLYSMFNSSAGLD